MPKFSINGHSHLAVSELKRNKSSNVTATTKSKRRPHNDQPSRKEKKNLNTCVKR